MSVCIVGAGLAGLATGIKVKLSSRDAEVLIIEKPHPESNSQISGQRFRERISGRGYSPVVEVQELLSARNGQVLTENMRLFASLAAQEIKFWKQFDGKEPLPYSDQPEWFGSQFGRSNAAGFGRGASVLKWYREQAHRAGVKFATGEATALDNDNGHIQGIRIKVPNAPGEATIHADAYVLAAGSIGGAMFESTNKNIKGSAQELAFRAGIPLWDSTLHMIHPFGNADSTGRARVGCFETDNLQGVKVHLANGAEDKETSALLEAHQAHYHFPDISRRIWEAGGTSSLEFPNGKRRPSRVSHHYSHLSIETTDGVAVAGVCNLFAVGDAAGLGVWTEHRIRLPGFALSNCLVTAVLAAKRIPADRGGRIFYIAEKAREEELPVSEGRMAELRRTNTEGLLKTEFAPNREQAIREAEVWNSKVQATRPANALGIISELTTRALLQRLNRRKEEPIILSKEALDFSRKRCV